MHLRVEDEVRVDRQLHLIMFVGVVCVVDSVGWSASLSMSSGVLLGVVYRLLGRVGVCMWALCATD